MRLWCEWLAVASQLRPAFSRYRTFMWFLTSVAGFSIREDNAGVTSFVRALRLAPCYYQRLLDHFHSSAVKLDKLAKVWLGVVLKSFPIPKVNGRILIVGDGIKVGKEGRKMPAVKVLHQESSSNTKAPWIMGHSFQVLGLLTGTAGYYFCVPLIAQIHEGIKRTNRDRRTLHDKFIAMLGLLGLTIPAYLILDSYYANKKIIKGLWKQGHHLISRMKSTAVAYYPAVQPKKRKRGRPRKYGAKVVFEELFQTTEFLEIPSPIYGALGATIRYATIDLLWEPIAHKARFVLVEYSKKGKCVLVATDLTLSPIQIIEAYGLRFKIEVGFKQALNTLGSWSYRFWMKGMDKVKRGSLGQYLHRKPQEYRDTVLQKVRAYECHVQAGLIAQGLLQYLAIHFSKEVWASFSSWIRTIRPNVLPSEAIVAKSLRSNSFKFFEGNKKDLELAKFIVERQEHMPAEASKLATG